MANTTIYSFTDTHCNIQHPSKGQFTMDGEGVGSFNCSQPADVTEHNRAADGSIMISKIAVPDGLITVTCQQTSLVHGWLLGLFNYTTSENVPASEFALATVSLRNKVTGDIAEASGVSFQKRGDLPFQVQGQMVTWNLMCASLYQTTVSNG